MGGTAIIEQSLFEQNHATLNSGAIRLKEAGKVLFKENKFIKNKVNQYGSEWRFGDAGAIYYECNPLELEI